MSLSRPICGRDGAESCIHPHAFFLASSFAMKLTSRTWPGSAFLSLSFLEQAMNILFGLNSYIQLKRSDQRGPKRGLEKWNYPADSS